MTRLRFLLLFALLAMPVLSALADGSGPAVSDPNGKLSVEGGRYDGDGAGLALGSYTLPLGSALGLQADGAVGRIGGDTMGGGGVHLFTRDPSRYLFGLYGSYHTWDRIDIWRAAGEVQLYLGRISVNGLAGYERVDVPATSGGLVVLDTDDGHPFAYADLAYYLSDDLRITGGYRYVSEASLGAAGIEYMLRGLDAPVSLFAQGDFGKAEFARVTGGLRIYLGGDPNKTLIERHRTDDPENYTPMFPTLKTQAVTPQCVVNADMIVTSPADGQCICGPSTFQPGSPPSPGINGGFACFTPN